MKLQRRHSLLRHVYQEAGLTTNHLSYDKLPKQWIVSLFNQPVACLCPDLQQCVPGTSAQRIALRGNAKAGHSIVVRCWHLEGVVLSIAQRVPAVTIEVIIAGEEQSARSTEPNRCYSAQDPFVRKFVDLPIASHVKQPASGVVGPCAEGVAVWEERY